jgi:hypothetical protein
MVGVGTCTQVIIGNGQHIFTLPIQSGPADRVLFGAAHRQLRCPGMRVASTAGHHDGRYTMRRFSSEVEALARRHLMLTLIVQSVGLLSI